MRKLIPIITTIAILIFLAPVIANAKSIVQLEAGQFSSYALLSDGSVWSWGNNWYGQLGIGTIDSANSSESSNYLDTPKKGHPTPAIIPGLSNVISISAGNQHAAAVTEDGSVWIWGSTSEIEWIEHEAGATPQSVKRLTPTQITELKNITKVAAATNGNFLALDEEGQVWVWGSNYYGIFGNGESDKAGNKYHPPEKISGLPKITDIAASHHVLALDKQGQVWAWGANPWGQVGNGKWKNDWQHGWSPGKEDTTEFTPTKVLDDCIAIDTGSGHSIALKKDGTVWVWGDNSDGILGLQTTTLAVPTPTQVKELSNIKAITALYKSSAVLKEDGTVWAWGYSFDSADSVLQQPTQVKDLNHVKAISGGGFKGIVPKLRQGAFNGSFLLVKKDNQSVWGVGNNEFGQLGNGGFQYSVLYPTQIKIPGLSISTNPDTINPIKIKINGNLQNFTIQPIIKENRLLVPFREIFERLGASVEYNAQTKQITATKSDKIIKLTIGSTQTRIGEIEHQLDTPPEIIEEHTMVPLRFVGEALQYEVHWDDTTRTVTIEEKQ